MLSRRILIAGALLAALGIACGAFAAHALRASLDPVRLGWWQTGVQYQMWNAIGLVAIAALPVPKRLSAALLIGLGTIIFSGSLYLLALTGARWLGMITPLGGLAMISGWLLLALHAARSGD